MHFRSYIPSDLEAMCRLDVLCFAEPFRFDHTTMQQFAEEPRSIVILVDDQSTADAQLIGFIIVQVPIVHLEGPTGDLSAYVVTIDVSPEHRRHGVGAAMLARAEAAARLNGATQITLHVAAGNHGAIAFYKGQKFRRSGVAKCFYREAGQNAILFSKPL